MERKRQHPDPLLTGMRNRICMVCPANNFFTRQTVMRGIPKLSACIRLLDHFVRSVRSAWTLAFAQAHSQNWNEKHAGPKPLTHPWQTIKHTRHLLLGEHHLTTDWLEMKKTHWLTSSGDLWNFRLSNYYITKTGHSFLYTLNYFTPQLHSIIFHVLTIGVFIINKNK